MWLYSGFGRVSLYIIQALYSYTSVDMNFSSTIHGVKVKTLNSAKFKTHQHLHQSSRDYAHLDVAGLLWGSETCVWALVLLANLHLPCHSYNYMQRIFPPLSTFHDLLLYHSCQKSGFTDRLLNGNIIKMQVECHWTGKTVEQRLPVVNYNKRWAREPLFLGKARC